MVERDEDRLGSHPPDDDPDAPASAEEIAASQRLRDALAGTAEGLELDETPSPELELALALRAAWDPATISEDESRAVLDVTPTAEEQHDAAALRDALAEGCAPRATDGPHVHLAQALRAAFSPAALDAAVSWLIARRRSRAPAPAPDLATPLPLTPTE